jgi:hypothetical protein
MYEPTIDVIVAQPRFRQPPSMTFDGILKRFPGLAEAEAVCWTGSTAIGWGNVYSDYDLFAFSDQILELPVDETMETWPGVDKSGIRWENWMGEYEQARVDLTVWPTATFATVLKPYLEGEVELCGTSEGMLAFIYRMSIATPMKNEKFFLEARELLEKSSFRRARARTAKVWAENSLIDVAGQLDNNDQASARISARVAAFRATDACLALFGDFCHDEKWTMRRLAAKPECGIDADEFRSMVLDGARPGESDGDCALRVARWAQGHLVRLEGEFLAGA